MINIEVIDTGVRSASENMMLDEALLKDLAFVDHPILHLYDWETASATYGYFVDPVQFLNMEAVEESKLSLARRPTGGGIVFHNCDLAFSVLIPASHPSFSHNPLENYSFVNHLVIKTIEKFLTTSHPLLLPVEPLPLDEACRHFCMAKPTKYDVMIQGKKVGGAAQRKTRNGYLHQGSISLGMLPDIYLQAVLKEHTLVLEGMKKHSFPLLGPLWTEEQLNAARIELKNLLQQTFVDSV